MSNEALLTRDQHLFGPGRKRILSLDGGGVRGILSIGALERLEQAIETLEGRPVRLGEWFDLIGGVSTGAIIAAGLALGYTVAELRRFYEQLGPQIFRRSWRRLAGWQAKFDARSLKAELDRIIGARTLDSADLTTGLCVVLKRLDTGSTWVLLNNPRSAFWEDPPDRAFLGNRHLPLANVVRASTAAPSFFDPEAIEIVAGQKPGVFIDGGLTPHNNPSVMLMQTALLPAYGLNWRSGPDDLLIVSVGTGSFRPTMSLEQARKATAFGLALRSLAAIIAENQNQALTLMSYFGRSPILWPINSEIGEVGSLVPPGGELFRFLRYDARLEADWLSHKLAIDLPPATISSLRRMDEAANMPTLLAIGQAAGARQVRLEHFEGFQRRGMPVAPAAS